MGQKFIQVSVTLECGPFKPLPAEHLPNIRVTWLTEKLSPVPYGLGLTSGTPFTFLDARIRLGQSLVRSCVTFIGDFGG